MGSNQGAVKGWFDTPGRPGDRTCDQQMLGLARLTMEVKGRTVLDVGCAEGLVALQLERAGARAVHGIEIVANHVEVARTIAGQKTVCSFECADANTWAPTDGFDVTIMLAILHKLRDPTEAVRRFAHVTRELCVVRLPPETAPIIVDERSGNVPHDISKALAVESFALVDVKRGAFNEWCGYFMRIA
jgi:SAM-dependent methyltransferase